MATDLKYNIESRQLYGKLGNLTISTTAGSGGRAGSKAVAENIFLANNSLATHVGGKSSKGTHLYGPIPRGIYTLKIHESRDNWIRLIPSKSNIMFGRDGFAIHGRGKTGSHGCIVPTNFLVIPKMIKVLKDNPQKQYTLEVVSIGPDIGWQNRIG